MWRFLRIVEQELFKDPEQSQSPTGISTAEANSKFSQLRSIFWRNYTSMDGGKGCFMAEKLGYIGLKDIRGTEYIGIKGVGLKFTTWTGLLNELAGSIANVPALVTLILSLIAIFVSVAALRHK